MNSALSYKKSEKPLNKEMGEKVTYNNRRSKNHQIYRMKQTKFPQSNYNDKHYWLNNFEDLPYGHYSIDD